MSYLEARRTHDLFDENGQEVGWIYKADTGEPLVYFLDTKIADQSGKLRIKPATDCPASSSADQK
jgi:hypothetical protein